MKTTILKEEITVPQGVFAEVADLIVRHGMTHAIIDTDEVDNEPAIILAVSYGKDEREAFHEIEDLIAEYEPEEQ